MLNPNNPQPPSYQTVSQGSSRPMMQPPLDWKHSLFGCCDDLGLCCFTMCCSCFQYAKVAEKVVTPNTSYIGSYWFNCLTYTGCVACGPCLFLLMGKFREDLRSRYQIPGSFVEDVCSHCCCHCCALIQESKEIEEREGKF